MKWPPHWEWDLNGTGLLPAGWMDQIVSVSARRGRLTHLQGDNSTSLEPSTQNPVILRVVSGEAIQAELSWLWDLYTGPLLDFAAAASGQNLYVANDVRSAININQIDGVDGRYEWHVDTNPITGILYASAQDVITGGQLIFRDPKTERTISLEHRPGSFICFDARLLPHYVTPLNIDNSRYSVPMNYYTSHTKQPRPADLNEYLYGSSREG